MFTCISLKHRVTSYKLYREDQLSNLKFTHLPKSFSLMKLLKQGMKVHMFHKYIAKVK